MLQYYSSKEDKKKLAKEMESFEEIFGDDIMKAAQTGNKLEGEFTSNIKDMTKRNKK